MELSFLTCLSVLVDVLAHIYIIYVSCSAGSKHDVLYKKGGLHDKFWRSQHPAPPPFFYRLHLLLMWSETGFHWNASSFRKNYKDLTVPSLE
jgi:hypothetical protein